MRKHLFLCLMALLTIIGMTSCDEKQSISFVTFKGFTVEPTAVNVGDTIIMKAYVDKNGKNLYNVKYNWTLEIDTISADSHIGKQKLTYSISSTPSRPIHMNDQPIAKFKIPANAVKGSANRQITFQVDYDNAADTEPMSFITPVQEGYLGREFHYNVLSILYSRTTSNFTCPITIK